MIVCFNATCNVLTLLYILDLIKQLKQDNIYTYFQEKSPVLKNHVVQSLAVSTEATRQS